MKKVLAVSVMLFMFILSAVITTAQALLPSETYIVLNSFTNVGGEINYSYTLADDVEADVFMAIFNNKGKLEAVNMNKSEDCIILDSNEDFRMKLMLFEPDTLTPLCEPVTEKDIVKENKVLNPGFEDGDTHWAEWHDSGTNSNAVVFIDLNNPHSGSNFRSHWSNGAAYMQSTSQTVTGLERGMYDLSLWIKSGGGFNVIDLIAKEYGGPEKRAAVSKDPFDWTEYTLRDIEVLNGQCQIDFLTIAQQNQQDNWVGFDDVSLTLTRKLKWSDEFDYEGQPNPENWSYEIGYCRNDEVGYYTDSAKNVYCDGEKLVIQALKDDTYKSRQRDYTSASIMTMNKFTFGKGYYVLRAKIPTADGMWPAWWMLGENKGWPACGEIDMMEYYNGKLLFNVMNVHEEWESKTIPAPSNFSDNYHTWGMLIDDDYICLYLDGVEMLKYSQENAWGWNEKLGKDFNPFLSQKMYMLINLAVGGKHGGNPSMTEFPQKYYIDYVRYYAD